MATASAHRTGGVSFIIGQFVPIGMVMFRSQRLTAAPLDEQLRGLPSSVSVYVLDEAWLVVSPSGLFVLTEDQGDLAAAARRAADRADTVRLELSDQLVWVPFIDAMCATGEVHFDPAQPCLVVPQDLVVHTVVEGPGRIDAETLAKLRLLGYPTL